MAFCADNVHPLTKEIGMNEARRKEINEVKGKLETMRSEFQDAVAQLKTDYETRVEEAKSEIENIRDAEQEYYDNMPESFQNGEKGEKAQEAVNELESALSELEGDLLSELESLDLNIDEAVSSLDNAAS
jgi:DNA repair exonuclease SbcCD ATPase subunit